jgi:hypothetical protein
MLLNFGSSLSVKYRGTVGLGVNKEKWARPNYYANYLAQARAANLSSRKNLSFLCLPFFNHTGK